MIITHPGQAHRDDFLSCCLLIAKYQEPILRSEPNEFELNYEKIFVVDVGGIYDPAKRNFDHHQFSRDAEPICALSLIMQYMGYDASIFPWFKPTEILDSKGPFQFCANSGLTMDQLESLQSPIEGHILRMFSQLNVVLDDEPLYKIMSEIGQSMITYMDKLKERLNQLSQCHMQTINNILIFDARVSKEDPVLGVEIYCKRMSQQPVVTVTYDDRGPGYTLFRRNDDPRIDFSLIENEKDVIFAHKNGFIAKVQPEANVYQLIQKGIKV